MQVRALARVAVLIAALAILAGAGTALVQQGETPGPPHPTNLTVGDLPPSGFTLPSLTGELHELEALRGERALMIVFFRGTW